VPFRHHVDHLHGAAGEGREVAPLAVHGDLRDARAIEAQERHDSRVGRRLDGDEVARIDERLEQEIEPLLGAGRHEDALFAPRSPRLREPAGDLGAELRQAVRVRVLPELAMMAAGVGEKLGEAVVREIAVVGSEAGEVGDERLAGRRGARFRDPRDRRRKGRLPPRRLRPVAGDDRDAASDLRLQRALVLQQPDRLQKDAAVDSEPLGELPRGRKPVAVPQRSPIDERPNLVGYLLRKRPGVPRLDGGIQIVNQLAHWRANLHPEWLANQVHVEDALPCGPDTGADPSSLRSPGCQVQEVLDVGRPRGSSGARRADDA
jgi:hypothetical protein